jgi:histidine ammonia-lyase
MNTEVHHIKPEDLSIEAVADIVNKGKKLSLSEPAKNKVIKCREYLDNRMEQQKTPIYGINTGFGSLCNTEIGKADLEQLQENLVKSHACGTGDEVPQHIVKLMLLLKVQGLSYGHSGVQLDTVERLITFYNEDILPVVYEQGSLGASGDLAPLAHLSLPILGLGEVYHNGEKKPAAEVLTEMNLEPIKLRSKEGLALLNGTQFMSAYATHILLEWNRLKPLSERITALSLDAYDGRIEPFGDLPHIARKQPGQLKVAQSVRKLLDGSELVKRHKEHVQDPYSFRCVPQVHGASYDALDHVQRIVENEISSVTDNPTVFPDADEVISAGNFHGQPMAINLDYASIALAELGSISERRVYKLVSGTRGLPEFLVANPGLNSGFMIPQYTAASIVSQNKQLCTPSSIDTIDSSNGQEDHVSMGANGATKAFRILNNYKKIIAIELFNAAQAMEFRRPFKSSSSVEELFESYRKEVSKVEDDAELHVLIKKSINFVESYSA